MYKLTKIMKKIVQSSNNAEARRTARHEPKDRVYLMIGKMQSCLHYRLIDRMKSAVHASVLL